VTANETRQLVRRQRRHPVVEIDAAISSPAGPDPALDVDAFDLRRALAHLTPEDRTLLAMRYVAGLDSCQIASFTKKSASSVRSHLATLLARLRRELTDV
jgi:DNA-directed RNA polymerase specialized sigma24 family protein